MTPRRDCLKQKQSKHTAGTCFMLLLYEYKPPRVAQGPCITGHRDKKKEGGEGQRVHVRPCPVHSDPWERGREAAARYFGPPGSGMPIQCFLFSLFSLYARYSTGIHTRALTSYSCLCGGCEGVGGRRGRGKPPRWYQHLQVRYVCPCNWTRDASGLFV